MSIVEFDGPPLAGLNNVCEINGKLNSRPGTEQWPRQTTSGDLV